MAKAIEALILQTWSFSEREGKLGVIVGDSGHGKTVCLKEYARIDRNAVYIALNCAMGGGAVFAAVARALRLDPSGTLATVSGRVTEALAAVSRIIILDEASHLTVKCLNLLRQTIMVRGGCPLILAGNRALLKTLEQAGDRAGCESLDQARSRLLAILDLDAMAADDDGGFYTAEDIRRLYEYGGLKLTGDAVRALRRFCLTPGSGRLRTCAVIVAVLHTAGSVQGAGFIDAAAIRRAIETLKLPVARWLPLALEEDENDLDDAATAARAG